MTAVEILLANGIEETRLSSRGDLARVAAFADARHIRQFPLRIKRRTLQTARLIG